MDGDRVKEIDVEIGTLAVKLSTLRSEADKAVCVDKIKKLNHEKDLILNSKNKDVIPNKEVDSRLDHVDSKGISRGDIMNTGDTFATII